MPLWVCLSGQYPHSITNISSHRAKTSRAKKCQYIDCLRKEKEAPAPAVKADMVYPTFRSRSYRHSALLLPKTTCFFKKRPRHWLGINFVSHDTHTHTKREAASLFLVLFPTWKQVLGQSRWWTQKDYCFSSLCFAQTTLQWTHLAPLSSPNRR